MSNLSVHGSASEVLEWGNGRVHYRKTLIMVPLERKVPAWTRKLSEWVLGDVGAMALSALLTTERGNLLLNGWSL